MLRVLFSDWNSCVVEKFGAYWIFNLLLFVLLGKLANMVLLIFFFVSAIKDNIP